MARKASVRYWESRSAFMCWHDGRQHVLAEGPDDSPHGPVYAAACKAFGLLASGPSPDGETLSSVAQKYLAWCKGRSKPNTISIRRAALAHCCAAFGESPVSGLSAYAVETWAMAEKARRGWSGGTVRLTLKSLLACLRWAGEHPPLPPCPIKKLHLPPDGSRGVEVVLTPAQQDQVIAAAHPGQRDLLSFLRSTGCRPGEAAMARAEHYDARLQALILPWQAENGEATHKNAKTGKARVIFLFGETASLVERLIAQHPKGPIFRSIRHRRQAREGKPTPGITAVGIKHLMERLRKKTGIKQLIAYSFRHSYAVEWLGQGRPIATLAQMLGTSIKVIQDNYGHLADQTDHLRRLGEDFHRGRQGS